MVGEYVVNFIYDIHKCLCNLVLLVVDCSGGRGVGDQDFSQGCQSFLVLCCCVANSAYYVLVFVEKFGFVICAGVVFHALYCFDVVALEVFPFL